MSRPGYAHTIRVLEEFLETCVSLKRSLGPRTSHADIMRFLFEAAEPTISTVLQTTELRVILVSQYEDDVEGRMEDRDTFLDELLGVLGMNIPDSDEETASEAGYLSIPAADDFEMPDSQNQKQNDCLGVYPDVEYRF